MGFSTTSLIKKLFLLIFFRLKIPHLETSLFLTFFETSAKSEISPQAKSGRELFYDPSFGGTIDPNKASGMSCATCHADFDEEQEPDGQIRTGHSIIGVRDRGKSQWAKVTSDMFERAAGGAGFCYQRFLQRIPERKIDPSAIPEAQAEALMAYFDYMSVGKKSPEVKLQGISKDASKIAADQIRKMDGCSMLELVQTATLSPKKAASAPKWLNLVHQLTCRKDCIRLHLMFERVDIQCQL